MKDDLSIVDTIDEIEGRLQAWLDGLLESVLFLGVMQKYPQWHAGDVPTVFPD